MNCRELITFLETEVPLETAEGWDNPGFLVGDKDKEIKKVLVECIHVTMSAEWEIK